MLAPAIPKTVHQIWLGGDLPKEHRAYRDSWQDHHPGWHFILWTEDTLAEMGITLVNQDLYDRAERLAPGSEGQFRSDILRYELLYWYGGVYLDTDLSCQRPIDGLLKGHDMVAAFEDDTWVNNAFLAAVPAHPLVAALIEHLPASVGANQGARPNVMTGPQYLTRIWRERGLGQMRVLPSRLFYPYRWDELDRGGEVFPDAYAVHHWNNKRRKQGIACP